MFDIKHTIVWHMAGGKSMHALVRFWCLALEIVLEIYGHLSFDGMYGAELFYMVVDAHLETTRRIRLDVADLAIVLFQNPVLIGYHCFGYYHSSTP